MYIKLRKVRIHISFLFSVFLAFILNGSGGERLILVFVSALLHECAHLAFLISYGLGDMTLELNPGGARICGAGFEALPYRRAVICVAAGPAVNLALAAALFAAAAVSGSEKLYAAAGTNLALGGANLLPLSFLDGGRALYYFVSQKKDRPVPLRRKMRADTVIILILLILWAVLRVKGYEPFFLSVFIIYCVSAVIRGALLTRRRGLR